MEKTRIFNPKHLVAPRRCTTAIKEETACKKIFENLKNSLNYIEEMKEDFSPESYSIQIEIRKAQLDFFENRLKGHSLEIAEIPILNKLLKISQTLRQKYQDNLLIKS